MRDRLRSLTQIFVTSLDGDSTSLATFDSKWASFSETLTTCSHKLHSETLSMIHAFASTVSVVATSMIDLPAVSNGICHQFENDMDNILSAGLDTQSSLPSRRAAYMELSARWLVENIHDPYPSLETRANIATQSQTLRKDVDAWFIDARRRIGWNALRRKHFDNKRANIVKSAAIFFLTHQPLEPAILESEFATIQASATALLSGKYEESPLAHELDVAVLDMTPELCLRSRQTKTTQPKKMKRKRAMTSYPTPDRSPVPTSSLDLDSSEPESPFCSLNAQAASSRSKPRKRRRMDSVDVDEDEKYQRCPPTPPSPLFDSTRLPFGLPSPASSCKDIETSEPLRPMQRLVEETPTPVQATKRKRQLSNVAPGHLDKRARCSFEPAVRQFAPTPLAETIGNLDDWLSEFCVPANLPSLGIDAHDPNLPVEVELFDFRSFLPLDGLTAPTTSVPPTYPDATLAGPAFSLDHQNLDWFSFNSNTRSDETDGISGPVCSSPTQDGDKFSTGLLQQNPFQNIDLDPFNPSWLLPPSPHALNHDSMTASYHEYPASLALPPQAESSLSPTEPLVLSDLEKELKKRQIAELENQLSTIRAQIGQ